MFPYTGNTHQVMCSSTQETHIPSDRCFPTQETHIPSDMYSPTQETHILSDVFPYLGPGYAYISLVICVPLPDKKVLTMPRLPCLAGTWK